MSAKNFCTNLGLELEAWKKSINGIVDKIEAKPGHAKAAVLENIEDMHILVEDLQARIDQLQETCSLDGFDDIAKQREIDTKSQVNVHDEESAVGVLGGGNFGG